MAKPLADRTRSALLPGARLKDVRQVLTDSEAELLTTESRLGELWERQTEPEISVEDARKVRDEAEDLELEKRRLEKAIQRLTQRLAEIEADESYQTRRDAYELAKTTRDDLERRILERVPAVFAELVEIAQAIRASDKEIALVNQDLPRGADKLISAEVTARGAVSTAYWSPGEPFERLTDLYLPMVDGPGRLHPPRRGSEEVDWKAVVPPRQPHQSAPTQPRGDRYSLSQRPYTGTMKTGVRHVHGVCGVGNQPVIVWMFQHHVRAAREMGLSAEPAPADAPSGEPEVVE